MRKNLDTRLWFQDSHSERFEVDQPLVPNLTSANPNGSLENGQNAIYLDIESSASHECNEIKIIDKLMVIGQSVA